LNKPLKDGGNTYAMQSWEIWGFGKSEDKMKKKRGCSEINSNAKEAVP
jgi:hypothetical protein